MALTTGFCGMVVALLLRVEMTPAPVPFAVMIVMVAFASLLYALGSGLARHAGRWSREAGASVDAKVLAASACAALVLAGLGALVGLWRASLVIKGNPALEVASVLRWVREAAGLGALGLLVALADGLSLLVLRRQESERIEEVRQWSRAALVDSPVAARKLTRTD